jgi:hypothetical protein
MGTSPFEKNGSQIKWRERPAAIWPMAGNATEKRRRRALPGGGRIRLQRAGAARSRIDALNLGVSSRQGGTGCADGRWLAEAGRTGGVAVKAADRADRGDAGSARRFDR